MGPGMVISRTMTIVQNPDGLVLINSVRLSDAGLAELDRLGKVKHLVKLSDSHGVDDPFYVERYKPEVWALPQAKLQGFSATKALGPSCPIAGGKVVEYPGTSGWLECGLWIPNGGGTLITTDAIQNHADAEYTSLFGRVMSSLMGFKGGVIVAPMWRRFQKVRGPQVKTTLAQISGLAFANLITGHGPAVTGGADAVARTAIDRASV